MIYSVIQALLASLGVVVVIGENVFARSRRR
jgi:hypothetical protein